MTRLAAYVDQLPTGLASYPEVSAKASIHRLVAEVSGTRVDGLPRELQQHLDDPSVSSKWIPACHTLALVVALVEAQGLRPADEGAWVRTAAGRIFASPMYRILMWAASPRMIMKGANLRWSAFFRGCELVPSFRTGERACDLVIDAPAGLFNEDLARIFTDVLRSAMSFTEESDAGNTLDLVDFAPTRVHYVGRW